MQKVIIESPYAGRRKRNLAYLKGVLRYVTMYEHKAPFASHLFFTQFLDDDVEAERALGIEAGFWLIDAPREFWIDLGMSPGMQRAWDRYGGRKRSIDEVRDIDVDTFDLFRLAGVV